MNENNIEETLVEHLDLQTASYSDLRRRVTRKFAQYMNLERLSPDSDESLRMDAQAEADSIFIKMCEAHANLVKCFHTDLLDMISDLVYYCIHPATAQFGSKRKRTEYATQLIREKGFCLEDGVWVACTNAGAQFEAASTVYDYTNKRRKEIHNTTPANKRRKRASKGVVLLSISNETGSTTYLEEKQNVENARKKAKTLK